jgi:hypothetical protein
VVDGEEERLEGLVVHGSLIAGLTTSAEPSNGGGPSFDGGHPEGATVRGSDVRRATSEEV